MEEEIWSNLDRPTICLAAAFNTFCRQIQLHLVIRDAIEKRTAVVQVKSEKHMDKRFGSLRTEEFSC